jgi:hypothetical protein
MPDFPVGEPSPSSDRRKDINFVIRTDGRLEALQPSNVSSIYHDADASRETPLLIEEMFR